MQFRRMTVATALILGLGLAMPLWAQDEGAQAQPETQQEAPSAADFSEDQLESFAEAHGEVMEVRDDYTQRLQEAEGREQAMSLQEEANEKMVEAVTDTGLSVEEYGQIARAASNDTELAERIQQMMN
ncbi:DUF4168 domain-containing protein [Sediminicurvatus halobius]|uniref:DUF4168 domain-containing protein n=1 Tax=Sediminicurvatus halobius TaxID=2182432 RepID=A0A2U2N9B6_9GAMM|nr:DUF4168 domain-containing protein [Spiribacter halobius]PWG65776.1 hypothetical protein DEM34_00475 [Spiribacter halobius]UEX77816.1 DUF4168 domain-containing protein [Spiribacter halobius]